MDAASNRKIEDARDIRENVRTLPFDSKYKVYILDEVHMLTKEAWNALLKTIEEPPEYVIFILATTELEKVPETIVSRCQTFVFKKPTDPVLAEVITRVAKKEGYTLEEGGAELIALIASGAFRDALGTLQKVISFSKDKKISLKEIEAVTGAPESGLVHHFLDALASNSIEEGYRTIQTASEQNIDMLLFLKMILSKLRYALMLRYAPETKKYIAEKIPEEELKYLTELIAEKPLNISSGTLSILLDTYQSSRTAVIDSLPLELALIKIIGGEK